ncbi:MAG: hypothetical protein L6R28_00455 [Planctomycetes bacterium]|nr:hypothetical protein [Planctomycetota bacterium]
MAADATDSGLRYSSFDLIFFVVLAAAQCYFFVEYIGKRAPTQDKVAAMVSAAAIGLGIAFGSGFLASRRWTDRKIESRWARVGLLVAVTVLLYAIILGFGILILLIR